MSTQPIPIPTGKPPSSANWGRTLVGLIVLVALLGQFAIAQARELPQAQPQLIQLAAEAPGQLVTVIVQKTSPSSTAEELAARLGGTIIKDLRIINAFSVELTASAARELAASQAVRWVSLDAPTTSSMDTCAITLPSIADTEIDEQDTSVANGSATRMMTEPSPIGQRKYVIVQFDTSSLPAGASILNATLGVYVQTARSAAHTDLVHVMNTAWTEAATWNTRDGTSAWTNGSFSSNDYDATRLGTIVPNTTGFKTLDVTGTIANWVNGTVNNLSFLIRSTGTDTGDAAYITRESAANRPYLFVSYTGACVPPKTGFVTWGSTIGNVVANGFQNSAMMIDSGLGPNGTYGAGANVKGSFGGFVSEATPGSTIAKVEAVLQMYVPAQLGAAEDPTLNVYVGGVAGTPVQVMHQVFDPYIGAANAGLLVVDITRSRTWQWSDFDNNLQLMLDQTMINKTHAIYYDAIGLRVTSASGSGTAGDTGGDGSALASITTSQQVNVYNQTIRASELWNTAAKIQGKGVGVAIVDSGIYKTKDLSKRVRTNANFNVAYHDSADRYGHGTFVAGIIAGNGSQSGNKYIGVAPRADILNVRVSNDQGMSNESDVVSALQWVLDNKAKYNIRVVNLSLNSSVAQSYHTSPLDAACEILWFNGIVVVVSAGNNGTSTLFPPANDPFVITVGATDDRATQTMADDTIAAFSAYGTTESGFAKPDLVAPGRRIIGLLPENDRLSIGRDHAQNRIDTTYFRMSGTSVSAPMVSGAVALLLQDEPNLTPDQVKYRLMATANRSWPGYNATTAGAGYLDVAAAVYGTTTTNANTDLVQSQLLWANSATPQTWNSASWGSASWGSASWGSASWGSASWGSDYWEP